MEEQANDSKCHANYLLEPKEEMLDDLVIPYHSEDDTEGGRHLDDELNELNVDMVMPIKTELTLSENIVQMRRQYEAEHGNVSDEVSPVKINVEIKTELESALSVEVHNTQIHTGEKAFRCRRCDEKFSCRRVLTAHMQTHPGEEPYSCHICQKKFFFRRHLNTHLRTHTGQKPYPCELCKRTFSKRINLTKHMRTHTGEHTDHCEVCQSGTNENNLTHRKVSTP